MNELNKIEKDIEEIKKYALIGAKDVLTLQEVALYTGLSKAYIYDKTCHKQIPHYRPNGKLLYFDKADIIKWLKRNRIATADEIEAKAVNYVVTGRKGGEKL